MTTVDNLILLLALDTLSEQTSIFIMSCYRALFPNKSFFLLASTLSTRIYILWLSNFDR